jgi:methionyl aminopeptidase
MDSLKKLQAVGAVAKKAHQAAKNLIKPGVNVLAVEAVIKETIERAGMKPAFLGYKGYPAASCISVNDEIVHGIPTDRILEEGDIVSVDLGVESEGYIVDTARTHPVGQISGELTRLLAVTDSALKAGVGQAKDGHRTGDIGSAVEKVIKSGGFAVIRDLTGHGVGKTLQEPPSIPNFGTPGKGELLKEGMVLAIEPITSLKKTTIAILDDGWTIVALDHRPTAHFEDTVLVTKDGPIVLT